MRVPEVERGVFQTARQFPFQVLTLHGQVCQGIYLDEFCLGVIPPFNLEVFLEDVVQIGGADMRQDGCEN